MPARSGVVRALTVLAVVGGALVALAGSIVLNGLASVFVAVIAGLVGLAAFSAWEGDRAAAVAVAVWAAAGTAAVVLVVAGVVVLGGRAAAVVVCMLAVVGVAAVVAARLLRRGRAGSAGGGKRLLDEFQDAPTSGAFRVAGSPLPVSLLPTPALVREWRRTTVAVRGRLDAPALHALVERRGEILDELRRRDPDAFPQ